MLPRFVSVSLGFVVVVSVLALSSVSAVSTCDSPIYCPGDILKTVQLAAIFNDSKTFVDKPTKKPLNQVLAAYQALISNSSSSSNGSAPSNTSIAQFVSDNFGMEGQELQQANLTDFKQSPSFLKNISDAQVRDFSAAVHSFWPQLARTVNTSFLCQGCVSSFLPVNNTFIVPGGRFREPYYWDTFFIIEGALVSELYDTVKSIIQNFLDLVNQYGFVPNGARIYYLNRSQPPFLTQMVRVYYERTKDVTFLKKALPTLDKEYQFWMQNTSIKVVSPYSNKTRHVNIYNVVNSAPRPESYLEDYKTVENDTVPTNRTYRDNLYADLATGAETGMDYMSRWVREPQIGIAGGTNDEVLRTIATRQIIPVELNSILYYNEVTLAKYFALTGDQTKSTYYNQQASSRKAAMLDLMWDGSTLAFSDFNRTANARTPQYSLSNYYPYWAGIFPSEIRNNADNSKKAYQAVYENLAANPGAIANGNLTTGLQWDFPNVWPPTYYILTSGILRMYAEHDKNKTEAAALNIGINERRSLYPRANSGNYSWAIDLSTELAQRYVSSTLCSWYATGGNLSQDGLPPNPNATMDGGIIFEKFNATSINAAGGGGEYTVQVGFGWSNGALLWSASTFGQRLQRPSCPPISKAGAATPMRK